MDVGEVSVIVTMIGVIVAIVVSAGVLFWQINVQGSRNDSRMDRMGDDIKRLDDRVGRIEASHARLEGLNESLVRILQRQSHTHPPHNPPVDQEAAAD